MPLALRSQSATRQFEVEAQRSVAISAHVAGKRGIARTPQHASVCSMRSHSLTAVSCSSVRAT